MRTFLEFGPFRLDKDERVLRCEGKPVPLSPKSFDMLMVLVENRGRLLKKDDLMKLVWPDSFVEEGNLSHHVFTVRKALGDEKGTNKYIETVPRRGYRFIADVRSVAEHAGTQAPGIQAGVPGTKATTASDEAAAAGVVVADTGAVERWRWSRPAPLAAALGAVAAVALGAYWLATRGPSPAAVRSGPRTIAVLPFKPVNVTDRDESLEWGMAETLITKFSGVGEIAVRSVNSVRRYSGLDQDPAAAGRELGVEAVLDGTIQWAGDRLRVNVRLIRAADGTAIWVRAFDEKATEILAMQDSIAAQVATSLLPELSPEARSRLSKRGTDSSEAYQLYIRGRYLWSRRTRESLASAVEHFNRAIEKDADYALAHSGIADCYIILHDLPPHERMPKARDAALKALAIDPDLAEAHVSLARIKERYEWDWSGAERELRQAIVLDPHSADAYRTLSIHLMQQRRFPDAEKANEKARDLEPLSLAVNKQAAWLALHRKDYDRAIALYSGVLELDPYFPQAQREIGIAFLLESRYPEALQALLAAWKLPQNYFTWTNAADLAHAYAVSGNTREAKRILTEMEHSSGYVDPHDLALVNAGLGDRKRAFEWLEKAYVERSYWLAWLGIDPRWDPLRSDTRFRDLERSIGLAQFSQSQ